MNPIILVDDDQDDLDLLRGVIEELNVARPLQYFQTGKQLIHFLRETDATAALVICDINMPVQNGFELKERLNMDAAISHKTISFVYLTTGASPDYINTAIKLSIDGFYRKPTEYSELKKTMATILERYA